MIGHLVEPVNKKWLEDGEVVVSKLISIAMKFKGLKKGLIGFYKADWKLAGY
jgi:hypothetical protein